MISVCCSCWFCLYALLLMLLLCHVSPLLHLVYYTFFDYVVAFPWIIIVAIVTRFVCSVCFPLMCFTSWYCGRYYVCFFLILLSFVASFFFYGHYQVWNWCVGGSMFEVYSCFELFLFVCSTRCDCLLMIYTLTLFVHTLSWIMFPCGSWIYFALLLCIKPLHCLWPVYTLLLLTLHLSMMHTAPLPYHVVVMLLYAHACHCIHILALLLLRIIFA